MGAVYDVDELVEAVSLEELVCELLFLRAALTRAYKRKKGYVLVSACATT